jgi:hypothetical protein
MHKETHEQLRALVPEVSRSSSLTASTLADRLGVKIGERSQLGPLVESIVLDTEDCVVFLDESWNVCWQTDTEPTADFEHVIARVAELDAILLEGLTVPVRRIFRTMVAEGVARALEDEDNLGALKIHDRAEAFVRARLAELARSWVVSAALQALVVAAVIGLTWALVPGTRDSEFVTCMCAGAAGAALSVLSRVGSTLLDPSAGQRVHTLETTAHVLVGALGSFVAFLGVKAKLLFPSLNDGSSAHLLLISFIAGAVAERLVPSLADRLDGLRPVKRRERSRANRRGPLGGRS